MIIEAPEVNSFSYWTINIKNERHSSKKNKNTSINFIIGATYVIYFAKRKKKRANLKGIKIENYYTNTII